MAGDYWIFITADVMEDENLKSEDKILYGYIFYMCGATLKYTTTIKDLSKTLHIPFMKTVDALDRLIQTGRIREVQRTPSPDGDKKKIVHTFTVFNVGYKKETK